MWFCACWFVCLVFSFFFFFQAEDGIRDWSVTGVQTCALPILVALLDLAEVMDKPVRQLSLGERMKCELAAALLHRPEILFLDEPTLGLDVTAQEAVRGFLCAYRARHGATILLTSHYMADVTALASRVLIINRGRLLYDGALQALVARMAHTKRLELVLGDGVSREQLAAFGEVREFRFPNAVLEVPRDQATAASARDRKSVV